MRLPTAPPTCPRWSCTRAASAPRASYCRPSQPSALTGGSTAGAVCGASAHLRSAAHSSVDALGGSLLRRSALPSVALSSLQQLAAACTALRTGMRRAGAEEEGGRKVGCGGLWCCLHVLLCKALPTSPNLALAPGCCHDTAPGSQYFTRHTHLGMVEPSACSTLACRCWHRNTKSSYTCSSEVCMQGRGIMCVAPSRLQQVAHAVRA